MLAEIYDAPLYRDPQGHERERDLFLAACPGESLFQRPPPLPAPSPFFDRAETHLAANGDAAKIIAMTEQGLRDDEWRMQRIRPFDWYTSDYKREAQQALRARYWQAWAIQVRCYRQAAQPEKAAELLALMEQRAAGLRRESGGIYRSALEILARLYGEAGLEGKAEAFRRLIGK